jgi:hypothetical protein
MIQRPTVTDANKVSILNTGFHVSRKVPAQFLSHKRPCHTVRCM